MVVNPFEIFKNDWALVTAGKICDFNTMTIGWGMMGTLWRKPIVSVFVKPCRYTHDYIEKYEYFTVSFFDENYKKDLEILGTLSKRDGDKLSKTSLTPLNLGKAITFKEAKCTIVLKKIYQNDLDISKMPQDAIYRYYEKEAPHTMYVGEVIDIIENK